ncbi:YraN family protein [Proteiniborus sp. MB09-C3]|uniref:YraN family protein n=1 Tax=Proteiniborus sp. MB09-C3 TaxID=3050072 RepID=UPI0025524D7F|nr:YraN family protein [Proteiniborus sp. MB09-C3]WIV10846.1 YraN family protein [Proteiniborus sp. MB09-C3]
MNSTRNIGIIGEDIAERYLLENDYKVLERNFRVKAGEIDIIAQKNQIIIFVEVKARSSNKYGFPYESVDYRKQQKIIRVAENYIKFKGLTNCQYRFDIIEVFLKENKKINHIQNAFWA